MSEPFDPYYLWLGIPPKHQPPDYYRLLGLEQFESNPEVIRDAASRQMAHVRTYQLGQHLALSQKILNELAAAKAGLSDSERKAAYDASLRTRLPETRPAVETRSEAAGEDFSFLAATLHVPLVPTDAAPGHAAHGRRGRSRWLLGVIGAAGLVIIAVVVLLFSERRQTLLAGRPQSAQAPDGRHQVESPKHRPIANGEPMADSPSSAAGQEFRKKLPETRQLQTSTPPASSGPPLPNSRIATAGLISQPSVPPLAVAPFGGQQAKAHQEAWAKYLGVPVEAANSIGMKLVLIPPGEFSMGASPQDVAWLVKQAKEGDSSHFQKQVQDESPLHRVQVSKPFYFAIYAVTQGEYEKLIGSNPSAFTAKQLNAAAFSPPLPDAEKKAREADAREVAGEDVSRHPVDSVTWDEAVEFCRRLSAIPTERAAKRFYRLPTEAEWEYACRAGTTTRWYCGDDESDLADVAWFAKNSRGTTHPVGERDANAWGLFDMAGNILQWCADCYNADYYKNSSLRDPTGPSAGVGRVLRGGAWTNESLRCSSAWRGHEYLGYRSHKFGFRVACVMGDLPGAIAESHPDARATANVQNLAPPIPAPPPKHAVPSAEDQQKAEGAFRDTYRKELAAAHQPSAKAAMAQRLFALRSTMNNQQANLFILLRHTIELAADAGQCDLMSQAIDFQAQHYEVQLWPITVEAFSRAIKAPQSAESLRGVVVKCMEAVDEAIEDEQYDAAEQLASQALATSRKCKSPGLIHKLTSRANELKAIHKEYDAGVEAAKILAKNPNDAAANAIRGKYLLALRHDWTAGLPYLGKGDDQAAAEAAIEDLADPQDAAKQVLVGDVWLKLAEKAGNAMAGVYRARAAWWYQKALPQLDDTNRSRVQKAMEGLRIADADRIRPDLGFKDADAIPVGEVRRYLGCGEANAIAAVPGGQSFLITGWGGKVTWYSLADSRVLLQAQKGEVNYGIAVSPDGRRAVCGGKDHIIHVLDLKSNAWSQCPADVKFLFTPIFFQDCRHVLYGTNSDVRIFDLDSKQEVRLLEGSFPGYNEGSGMSSDDRLVLSASLDKVAQLLDAAKELHRLADHTRYGRRASISFDGHLGLTSGDDKTARLWDLGAGKELRCFSVQPADVHDAALIENGRYVLTAGSDLRLWNAASGELIASYETGLLYRVCPLPDNRFVLCCGENIVHLWQLPLTKTGRILKSALPEPTLAIVPAQAAVSIAHDLEAAIARNDASATRALLVKADSLIPNDPRLSEFRRKADGMGPPRTAPAGDTFDNGVSGGKMVLARLPGKTIPETVDTKIGLPRSGGPYKLVGRVTITKFGTLFIERGTTVVASPGAAIIATGELTSYGDADDYVKFRPESPTVGWDKLDLEEGVRHTVERFDVRGAARGLYVGEYVTGEVKDCLFVHNGLGVEIKRTRLNDSLSFANCLIAENLSDGMSFFLSQVKLDHCTISGNEGIGLDLVYEGNVTAQNCSIMANGIGIKTKLYKTNVELSLSNIANNRLAAVVVRTEQDLQCKGNYWGTSNRQQIAASIIDGSRQPMRLGRKPRQQSEIEKAVTHALEKPGPGAVVFTDHRPKPIAGVGCSPSMAKR